MLKNVTIFASVGDVTISRNIGNLTGGEKVIFPMRVEFKIEVGEAPPFPNFWAEGDIA